MNTNISVAPQLAAVPLLFFMMMFQFFFVAESPKEFIYFLVVENHEIFWSFFFLQEILKYFGFFFCWKILKVFASFIVAENPEELHRKQWRRGVRPFGEGRNRGRTNQKTWLLKLPSPFHARVGVPHGTCVSPTLFNFFASTFPQSEKLLTNSYADDLTVSCSNSNVDQLFLFHTTFLKSAENCAI